MLNLITSLMMLIQTSKINEFELAIKQVTWQISTSDRLYRQDFDYCFDYQDNQRCLEIKNNRLILTPGTQIVLNKYDALELFEKENQLWIKVSKKGHIYEAFVYDIEP